MAKGWIIGGAVFLGALLVASIVLALLEREDELPLGTPEAAVQDFLITLEAEDFELAYDFLSEELTDECTLEDFASSSIRIRDGIKKDRVTLENSTFIGDAAIVSVRITQFHGSGPFGASESSHNQSFTLRQVEGRWKFADYPRPYFPCPSFKRVIPTPVPPPAPTRESEARPTATPTATPTPTP